MRKLFTFLCAALMSVGMYATTVTWNFSDLPDEGDTDSFTKDGVTLSAGNIDFNFKDITGDGTFTTTLGNFTKIEVTIDEWDASGDGWDGSTWTGNAASVSFSGDILDNDEGTIKFVFTIEPATPSWVRDGDEWEDATKTLTVNSNLGSYAYGEKEDIEHVIISDAVTSIGEQAFAYCYGIKSVTIPNSVTSIGNAAFQGCDGMTSVTIPNSITSIGDDVFNGCALTSITIPNSVTSIGNRAFYWCSGLTSITIPNSVTSIGGEAFSKCTGLTSITIPNSVTSIGGSAFYQTPESLTSIVVESGNTKYDSRGNCNAIIETSTNKLIAGCKNTIIPNSVTSIGDYAFFGCTGLTSITIPNGVTSIGEWAFCWCWSLKSITFPNSVTSIGGTAFQGCYALTSLTCGATTPPTLGSVVFAAISGKSNIPLYVPYGSVAAYEAAAQWNEFNIQGSFAITANEDPQNPGVYYSTFYYGGADVILPANVTAYKAAISDDALNLTSVAESGQSIPAGNAVILRSSIQEYDLAISTATEGEYEGNVLQGTDVAIAKPDNCYVLSCENNLVGFYQYGAANLNPHKAYVTYSGSGSNPAPRRMPFIFDAATGVENVQGNVQSTKVLRDGQLIIIRNGVEYNANGMMVK